MTTVNQTDDAQIIGMLLQRNEQAIRDVERIYGEYCYRIAYHILGNQQDTEECVNDALMKLWNAVPPAQPKNLRAFLSTLVRRTALDRIDTRMAAKRGMAASTELSPQMTEQLAAEDNTEHSVEVREMTEALRIFLSGLPKETRIMFVERYWHCEKLADIAAAHGVSIGSVKMLMRRTRDKLEEYLKEEGLL